MKKKIIFVLFALLTTLLILTISVSADSACTHEGKSYTNIKYTDYTQNGVAEFYCPSCSITSETVAPLVTFKGYSTSADVTDMCVGYNLNKEAFEIIKKTGASIEVGLVAASKALLGDNMPLDSKTAEPYDLSNQNASVIKAVLNDMSCLSADMKIAGFDGASVYAQLYLGAYVFDGNSVKYIVGDNQSEAPSTVTCVEATGKTEVTIANGYTFSLVKETKDADDRIKQMNNSASKYDKGSSVSTLKLYGYSAIASGIVLGGSVLGYDNAKNFMSHYLSNKGTQYTIDMNSFLNDAESNYFALNVRNKDINRALRAAEQLAIEGMSLNMNQCMEQVNHGLTGDWKYSVGSYFSRVNMSNLTVNEVDGVKTYSATVKYTVTDFYNWDEGDGNKVFDLISPYQLAQLHRAGMAREFLSVGTISYEITWTEGQTVDQIAGL